MFHSPCPNHVQLNIRHASQQMNPIFNGSGIKTILPESTLTVFPDVVRLPCFAGQQLHAFGNDIFTTIHGQQMDMIACYRVSNHPEAITFFSF
jgi:hypothetical protein